MNSRILNKLDDELKKIGKESLDIISKHRVNKNETWEAAIELNKTARDLHNLIFNKDEELMWDEFLQYCKDQENSAHE